MYYMDGMKMALSSKKSHNKIDMTKETLEQPTRYWEWSQIVKLEAATNFFISAKKLGIDRVGNDGSMIVEAIKESLRCPNITLWVQY